MPDTSKLQLRAMMGDYPGTHALHTHKITSPLLDLHFADVAVPNTAFKRTVRAMEFDVSELAIMTFLQAYDAGIPLALLPAVLISRFQHPYLMYDARRGTLKPQDLRGKRIGVRSYAVTTVTWIRGMLQREYGIDPSECEWVTFEDAHVAQWRDPSNARRAGAGETLEALLDAGELDAAVLASAPNDHVLPVFGDAEIAAASWHRKYGVIQINHMLVLKNGLCEERPDVPAEIYRMLSEGKAMAPTPSGAIDSTPLGLEAVRPHLDFAIDTAFEQRLISRRFKTEELFLSSTLI